MTDSHPQQLDRLEHLEAKLAYQDQAIQDLSNEIYRQQQELDQLRQLCRSLTQKLQSHGDAGPHSSQADERPPHY